MTIGFIELERRVKALEDRLAGQRKSLTFLDPKCNIPCTASLEQKIERLIAYFERHSRENQKRSEKSDKELQTTLLSWTDYKRNEHSSYYLSGKADAYARAAEKVRELLGEPKYPAMFGGKAPSGKTATGAVYQYPFEDYNKPAEKWIVEVDSRGSWKRSQVVPLEFATELEATQAMAEADKRYGMFITRRARRID